MENKDVAVYLLLGLVTGLWIALFHLWWLSKIGNLHRLPRFLILLFTPSIGWFAGVVCLLLCGGSHVPDWFGMAILASGILVFLASIVSTIVSLKTNRPLLIIISAMGSTIVFHAVLITLKMWHYAC